MQEDQLQSDDIDVVEPVYEEEHDDLSENTEADLAPASESDGHEDDLKLPPEVQKKVEKRIGKATFQWREAERKAEQLEAELKALRTAQAAKPVPVVPDYPDAFDPQFDQKVAQRDEAIRQRAAHDAQLAYLAQQENIAQQQKFESEQKRYNEVAAEYTKRSVALGVTAQELQYAGQGVASYLGHAPDLVEEILTDEVGPLITTYLAANVGELEKISLMKPIQAARYIESQIKPKLSARKPRISNAPDPVPKLGGNAPQGNSYFKHSKGAKFE